MLRRVSVLMVATALAMTAPALAAAHAGAARGHVSVSTTASTTPAASTSSSTPTAATPGSTPAASTPAATTPVTPAGTTNPFSPGVPAPQGTTTTSTPRVVTSGTSTSTGDSGLTGTGILLIVLGAVALIGGIAFFIWRDSRRRAGVRTQAARTNDRSKPGSKRPPKPRKLSPAERRRRKRGKAR